MYDGFIYETTCLVNGMKYRGRHERSHSNPEDPDDKDYIGSPTNPQFWVDLELYGRENFIREIIQDGPFENNLHIARTETIRLKEVDAANNPMYYNLSNWGGTEDQSGDKNPMKNPETVKKMSLSKIGNKNRLGKPFTEESRQKISKSLLGEKNPNYGGISESHRKHISESKQGEKNPMYGKRGEDSPRYGMHHTEESRKKISESKRGKSYSKRYYHLICKKCNTPFLGNSPKQKYCIDCKEII